MFQYLYCLTYINRLFNHICLMGLQSGAALRNQTRILILQKRTLRTIFFKPYRSHALPLFNLSNLLPINFMYLKIACTLMHGVINNLTPANISQLFNYSSERHCYNTRFLAAGNIYLKYSRTEHSKNSFSILDAKIWNSIPNCLRSLPKYKFKLKNVA